MLIVHSVIIVHKHGVSLSEVNGLVEMTVCESTAVTTDWTVFHGTTQTRHWWAV